MQRLAPPEHPLQQPQRAMLPLLLIRDALGLLARIFVRQFHELDVVAALRPADAHLLPRFCCKSSANSSASSISHGRKICFGAPPRVK